MPHECKEGIVNVGVVVIATVEHDRCVLRDCRKLINDAVDEDRRVAVLLFGDIAIDDQQLMMLRLATQPLHELKAVLIARVRGQMQIAHDQNAHCRLLNAADMADP
jgi:hypothetical protein